MLRAPSVSYEREHLCKWLKRSQQFLTLLKRFDTFNKLKQLHTNRC